MSAFLKLSCNISKNTVRISDRSSVRTYVLFSVRNSVRFPSTLSNNYQELLVQYDVGHTSHAIEAVFGSGIGERVGIELHLRETSGGLVLVLHVAERGGDPTVLPRLEAQLEIRILLVEPTVSAIPRTAAIHVGEQDPHVVEGIAGGE